MFVDRVRIRLTSGGGGNGCCSFRREAYVPRGGPNGGDGGDGGSIYLEAASNQSSLTGLRYHPNWTGNRGVHGMGKDRHGKNGDDIIIPVPCGTIIQDYHSGELLADLTEDKQRFLAVQGGRGGRGNARFATPINRAPRFSEKGEPGTTREFLVELKLIAEVGLVGLPNAGKSTFLSVVSAAKPKIADYPFTTLSPNLGVAWLSESRMLTIADIPGIIEGAADGKGLGHDFLRHIERTRVLVFLIDLGDEDPLETLQILENELEQYSPEFEARPRQYVFNKADIPENKERFEALADRVPKNAWLLSGASGWGVPPLLEALWKDVERAREKEADEAAREDALPPEREYVFEPPFRIISEEGGFRVSGEKVVRAVSMTDFENPEALNHLQRRLEKMGVFKALKRMDAVPGQMVRIGDQELEYTE